MGEEFKKLYLLDNIKKKLYKTSSTDTTETELNDKQAPVQLKT